MASQTPITIQNENLRIHTGKSASGQKINVSKPEPKGRKALADISNNRKPSLSGAPKTSFPKDKSAVRGPGNLKSISKGYDLTEEELNKCGDWAKGPIENVNFSGNDLHYLQKDIAKKRVDKEVDLVMSSLSGWTNMTYGLEKPLKDVKGYSKDLVELDPEPEVFLPCIASHLTSGDQEVDDLLLEEENNLRPFRDCLFEFKLEEEYKYNGESASGQKVNVSKPEPKGSKDRKALADISNNRKPSLSSAPKTSFPKDKSALRGPGNLKSISKGYDLTEEELNKCGDWAKRPIENVNFSGNDLHYLQKDVAKKRVDKEVDLVMSSLSGWTNMTYGLEKPLKDVKGYSKDLVELDPEPEVLLPFTASHLTSGDQGVDDPFLKEENTLRPFRDYLFEFKQKEEYKYNG